MWSGKCKWCDCVLKVPSCVRSGVGLSSHVHPGTCTPPMQTNNHWRPIRPPASLHVHLPPASPQLSAPQPPHSLQRGCELGAGLGHVPALATAPSLWLEGGLGVNRRWEGLPHARASGLTGMVLRSCMTGGAEVGQGHQTFYICTSSPTGSAKRRGSCGHAFVQKMRVVARTRCMRC